MAELIYPSKEAIINVNKMVNLMSNMKADAHNLLRGEGFIDVILGKVKKTEGDIYDKASVLLSSIVKTHGFASGNKRTGFVVTTYFLRKNGGKIRFGNFEMVEKVLRNIRLYNNKEIAEWLRTGDIDENKFKR
jgi:death-on-curing family protein